ncbi:hypothetical protein Tco_1409264 [Tanacetum coccineum]
MEIEHELSYEILTRVYLGSYEHYKSVEAEVEHPEPGFELQGAKMANEVLVTKGALQSEVGHLDMLEHEVGRLCDEYAWWKLTRRCWNTHVLAAAAIGTKGEMWLQFGPKRCCSRVLVVREQSLNEVRVRMFKIVGDGNMLKKGIGSVSIFEVGGQGNNVGSGVSKSGSLKQSGREVAVMDPVLEEGVDKWSMTVVGHFVGFQMGYREIVGHLKRMWRLYQLEENHEKDRLSLWRNLDDHNSIAGGHPWVLIEDFNVTLFDNENTNVNVIGHLRLIMAKDSLNILLPQAPLAGSGLLPITKIDLFRLRKTPRGAKEHKRRSAARGVAPIEDVPMTGMHYTGSKKTETQTEKPEFLDVVKAQWNAPIEGFAMFVLDKRLKLMKRRMRNLNKNNGNVFVKVKKLKAELERVQKDT